MKFTSIFLAGPPVSGKSTLAKMLAERLNFPIYSIGRMFREEWAKKYPNQEISFEEYWRNLSPSEVKYQDNVATAVFAKGNVIAEGRYAIMCQSLPTMLRILVTAPLEIRAQRALALERYQGKSVEEIKAILLSREEDEVKMGKELYGEAYDYRAADYYHFVVNSGPLSLDEEVAVITKLFDNK